MENFYFTFPYSSPLKDGYMRIESTSLLSAQIAYIAIYSLPSYAFIYTEEEFLPQIAKYNLYEIPFGYMPEE